MNTVGDIIQEVLVRANVTTTAAASGLYTESALFPEVKSSVRWAAGYHKWPFTEGRASTTYAASEIFDYFEGWKTDGVRIAKVGNDLLKKITFRDYLTYRDENTDGTDKIFSDHGRQVYINPNADVSGTLWFYGQYTPIDPDTADGTSSTATTVFSNHETDGNEAIVEKTLAAFRQRERRHELAAVHEARARALLDGIWKRMTDEQYSYHTHDRGMLERVDVLNGEYYDDVLRRNRFY